MKEFLLVIVMVLLAGVICYWTYEHPVPAPLFGIVTGFFWTTGYLLGMIEGKK